ncbi:unnamed protein product, partial [Discosporangium mesarthrocarpum]
ASESLRDRFYSALYVKLLSPDLASASSPVLFLNLCYRALRADRETGRSVALAKRLLQVSAQSDSALAAAALFVVSESFRKRPEIRSL